MSAEGLYATLAYTVAELAALNDPNSPLYAATVAQLRAAGKPVAVLDPQAVANAQAFRAGDPFQFERLTAQLQAQGYSFPGNPVLRLATGPVIEDVATPGGNVNPLTGLPFTPQELSFVAQCQQDPVACRNLIAAQAVPAQSASPVAGGMSMSIPFFTNLSGPPPGLAQPISFQPQFSGSDVFNGASGAVGLLGTLGGLAGQFFLQQQAQKAQEEAFKQQLQLLQLQAQLGQSASVQNPVGLPTGVTGINPNAGQVVIGANGQLQVGGLGIQGGLNLVETPSGGGGLGVAGGCCPRGPVTVSMMDAPALYRAGCGPCGTPQTRARFFALRADGTRDLFVRVGKVQSVSPRALTRFARRWAKEAGLTTAKRGSGGRRGRRRPR